MTYRMFPDMEH